MLENSIIKHQQIKGFWNTLMQKKVQKLGKLSQIEQDIKVKKIH